MIWVFHLPNIYSAWKATLLARNMEEGNNRQYLANYLYDNSDSENTQDANIQLSNLKEAIQLRFIMEFPVIFPLTSLL